MAHFAVVLGGVILFAVPSSNVILAQSGERSPTLPHHQSDPAQIQAGGVANGRTPAAVPSAPLAPPSWVAAAPYPTTIARYAFAQVGQDLYVISGFSSVILNTVNRYNATANTWTPLAPIPVGSEAPAAAYFKGKIYVIDGSGGNLIRIYDIATNTWTNGPPRPGFTDCYGAAAGAFNGNVYVVGGSGAAPNKLLSIYNISNNTWSSGPAAPADYELGGYTQVGQFLYLIGTSTGDPANHTNSTVSMRLDMSTNTWSTGPAWTPQRADFALAASGSKLFAIGGDLNGGGFFDFSTQVDELETSSWPAGTWAASASNLPSARQGNQAGFFSTGRSGGEIWSTGGVTKVNPVTTTAEHLFRPVPCVITFTGAIGSHSTTYPSSSGVQTNRVARLNNPSVCGVTKAFPGTSSGSFAFDQYSFTNNGPPVCVTFTIDTACTASQEIFAVAYLGSFNPANVAANYLGDIAFSPPTGHSFSVDVPANSTVVLVVSEVSTSACPNYIVTVNGLSCGFQLTSAVSKKVHGGTPFNINLPLVGAPGVECRTGGTGGNHTIVFTFNNTVVSGSATVTTGTGTAGAATFSGNTMTVPLTGVADQQKITVTLNGVTDNSSRVLASTPVSMNVLLGDTNGNKTVNSTDISQTKVQSGVAVSAANFRNDTNVSGGINATDISQVKVNSGHGVP